MDFNFVMSLNELSVPVMPFLTTNLLVCMYALALALAAGANILHNQLCPLILSHTNRSSGQLLIPW